MVELLRLSVAGSDTPSWVEWRDRWFGLDRGICFTDVGSVLQDTQLWYEEDCGCIIMGKNMIGLVRGARGRRYSIGTRVWLWTNQKITVVPLVRFRKSHNSMHDKLQGVITDWKNSISL